MNINEIKIGIADLNTTKSPNKLITVGLGSCVGIAIYDSLKKIGGLAHIMLPDSTQFSSIKNPMKFADLAIPILLKKMESEGAVRKHLKAKIVGGASMFNFTDNSMMMDIGDRNVKSVKKVLLKNHIQLISEDTGGSNGRTMIFSIQDGGVEVRTVGKGIRVI